ncbi:hypothetical protein D3C85_1596330 [compost metagenome]
MHLTVAGGLFGERYHLEPSRHRIETTGFFALLTISAFAGLGRTLEGRDRLQPSLEQGQGFTRLALGLCPRTDPIPLQRVGDKDLLHLAGLALAQCPARQVEQSLADLERADRCLQRE